jgi:hypothetical protein
MRSIRFTVLGALAILPLFAATASADRIAPRQHRPIQDRKDHGDGTSTSTNWSGYAVSGSAFTFASASWIVPAATCGSGHQYAAFWVGLDGYSSPTVEQTGTDSDCDGRHPSYYAWYEFYPNPSLEISSLAIRPGDRMSAQVAYSGGKFTITITDETTGKSYSNSATVSRAKRSSAEWIAEAPCCTARGGILPLADFGTVLLGGDSTGISNTNFATDRTVSGAIGAFPGIQQVTMATSGGAKEAVPSGLSGDGTSFSVSWFSK